MFDNERRRRIGRNVRVCGICSIQRGIRDLMEAIEIIERGLRELEECKFCEGVRSIEEGLERLRRGSRNLQEGLNNTDFRIRCKERRELLEILCDIEGAINDIERALNTICRGDVSGGIATIEEVLDDLERDLEELKEIIRLDGCWNKNDSNCNFSCGRNRLSNNF